MFKNLAALSEFVSIKTIFPYFSETKPSMKWPLFSNMALENVFLECNLCMFRISITSIFEWNSSKSEICFITHFWLSLKKNWNILNDRNAGRKGKCQICANFIQILVFLSWHLHSRNLPRCSFMSLFTEYDFSWMKFLSSFCEFRQHLWTDLIFIKADLYGKCLFRV